MCPTTSGLSSGRDRLLQLTIKTSTEAAAYPCLLQRIKDCRAAIASVRPTTLHRCKYLHSDSSRFCWPPPCPSWSIELKARLFFRASWSLTIRETIIESYGTHWRHVLRRILQLAYGFGVGFSTARNPRSPSFNIHARLKTAHDTNLGHCLACERLVIPHLSRERTLQLKAPPGR